MTTTQQTPIDPTSDQAPTDLGSRRTLANDTSPKAPTTADTDSAGGRTAPTTNPPSPTTTADADLPAGFRPWRAVVALLIGFFMLMLDTTIVSVANPSIQSSLNASLTATIWVTSAYLLGLATPMLIAGRLGDRFGQKTIFMIGMAIFAAASLACGLTGNIASLIAARAVQGIGGALMTPQTQAIIVKIFPPERRGAAMGLWGSVAGIATLVGPMIGGLLVQTIGWQAIFLINLPVGVVGLILAARFLPRLPHQHADFDWLGVLLSGLGIFALIFGLQEGVGYDWGSIWGPISVPVVIGLGLVALVAFVLQQSRARHPLVPLRLFRDRDFALANSAIFLVGLAISGMMLPLLYFIQVDRGMSPMLSALFQMPSAIIGAILAPLVGARVVARLGANKVALFGGLLMAGSLLWYMLYFTADGNIWWALLPGVTLGVGNACIWSPLSLSATQNLPLADAGAGAGTYNTMRQIGSTVGAAAMSTVMNLRLLGRGLDPDQAGAAQPGGLTGAGAEGYASAMADCLWLPALVFMVVAGLSACLTGQGGRRR